jgi:hypothetical protein
MPAADLAVGAELLVERHVYWRHPYLLFSSRVSDGGNVPNIFRTRIIVFKQS